jgi:hypothetical protein
MVLEIGGKDASYTFNLWILGVLRPLNPRKKMAPGGHSHIPSPAFTSSPIDVGQCSVVSSEFIYLKKMAF